MRFNYIAALVSVAVALPMDAPPTSSLLTLTNSRSATRDSDFLSQANDSNDQSKHQSGDAKTEDYIPDATGAPQDPLELKKDLNFEANALSLPPRRIYREKSFTQAEWNNAFNLDEPNSATDTIVPFQKGSESESPSAETYYPFQSSSPAPEQTSLLPLERPKLVRQNAMKREELIQLKNEGNESSKDVLGNTAPNGTSLNFLEEGAAGAFVTPDIKNEGTDRSLDYMEESNAGASPEQDKDGALKTAWEKEMSEFFNSHTDDFKSSTPLN